MHLTGGSLRHFWAFSTPEQNPALGVLSQPAHPQVTQTVGWQGQKQTQGNINIMRTNKTKLFMGVLVGLIAVSIIGILYYRVTAIIEDVFAVPVPPSAILQVQNMEQTAKLGAFNWDGHWADVYAIITPQDVLVVNSPIVATLKLSIDIPPSALSISVTPASKIKEFPEDSATIRVWELNPKNYNKRNDLLLKQEQTINLDLEHGLYVIVVNAGWQQGSVTYGFLIDVQ